MRLTLFLSALAACASLCAQIAPDNWGSLPRGEGWFRGRAVSYRVIDGMALAEGDILLGKAEDVAGPAQEKLSRESVAQVDARFRWPQNTVVYEFAVTLPNQARLTQAIAEWEAKTSIRFKRREAETDYVVIQRAASGCNANVGRTGGRQVVNLADNCSTGNVIHELGHTIGLFHTQSRIDREEHLTILYENIQRDAWDQYDQRLSGTIDLGPYDYSSIMHYGYTGFSNGPRSVIQTVPPGIPTGVRTQLSQGDVQAVHRLYGIPVDQVTIVTAPEGLTVNVDGVDVETPASFPWPAGSTHRIAATPGAGGALNANLRYRFGNWSHGGEREQTITVKEGGTLYIANYVQELRLRTDPGSNEIVATPASADGFYPFGTEVMLRAVAADPAGEPFLAWSAGPGGVTYLAANDSGNGANPTTFNVFAGNAFYVPRFGSQPVVRITSDPPGATVLVDRVAVLTPTVQQFAPGSRHTISIPEVTTVDAGMRQLVFREWADGRSREFTLEVGAEPIQLHAILAQRHRVFTDLNYTVPASTTLPVLTRDLRLTPEPQAGYLDAGTEVEAQMAIQEGQQFGNWFGDVSSRSNPLRFTINGSTLVGANVLGAPFFSTDSLVTDATLQPGPLSPGALMTLYTPGLADAPVQVQVGGIAVNVHKATANSITFQAPTKLPEGSTAPIEVRQPGRPTYSRVLTAVPAAPAIYPESLPEATTPVLRIRATGIGPVNAGQPALPLQLQIGSGRYPLTRLENADAPGQYWLTFENLPEGDPRKAYLWAGPYRSRPLPQVPVRRD